MSDPDYHRRQAAIFTRLSETARHPDTAAALLWLAEEHRAQVELSTLCPDAGQLDTVDRPRHRGIGEQRVDRLVAVDDLRRRAADF